MNEAFVEADRLGRVGAVASQVRRVHDDEIKFTKLSHGAFGVRNAPGGAGIIKIVVLRARKHASPRRTRRSTTQKLENVSTDGFDAAADIVHGRCARAELQGSFARVDANNFLCAVVGHRNAKTTHVAVKVENSGRLAGKFGQPCPVVAVVKIPAGLLAVKQIHSKRHAILSKLCGPTILAPKHLSLYDRSLFPPARRILPEHDDLWFHHLLQCVQQWPQQGIQPRSRRLQGKVVTVAVHSQPRQAIRLAVRQPVEGLTIKPFSVSEAPPKALCKKLSIDLDKGLLAQDPAGNAAMLVVQRNTEHIPFLGEHIDQARRQL
mmetsp:Transcript_6227/g.15294  ORF Transcript_6227/g.15294 Transcript_6227/m.15294 type:complete len:320 (-) Transcript_6227:249-1208(-)